MHPAAESQDRYRGSLIWPSYVSRRGLLNPLGPQSEPSRPDAATPTMPMCARVTGQAYRRRSVDLAVSIRSHVGHAASGKTS
jgi:hypothetical protein